VGGIGIKDEGCGFSKRSRRPRARDEGERI
jgi:hypothetical protein